MARSRESENPKASIRFDDMTEVDRLGVREADDRGGMKAFSDNKSLSQMLVRVFASQEATDRSASQLRPYSVRA